MIENKTSFELTSPGYPNSYPANKDCEMVVRFHDNATVKLTFLDFELFEDWDYLYVYDGANIQSQLIETLSGFSLPAAIYSTGNQMYLRLKTTFNHHRGFKIEIGNIGK